MRTQQQKKKKEEEKKRRASNRRIKAGQGVAGAKGKKENEKKGGRKRGMGLGKSHFE